MLFISTDLFYNSYQIQNVLGGRVQLISSAAAPINTEILNFLKIAFACEFIEGMLLQSDTFIYKSNAYWQGAALAAFTAAKLFFLWD